MKTGIIFFTGTGNSLRTAMKLKEQLERKGDIVELIDISKHKQLTLEKYEKVGIVFPIYCLGIPSIVKSFIKNNNFESQKYIFAIANCGSDSGIAFNQINKLLKKNKQKLKSTLTIRNGANNNLFINIPGTSQVLSEKAQEEAYKLATEEIVKISEYIAKQEVSLEPQLKLLDFIKSSLAHNIFMSGLKNYPKKFTTTNDCKQCGKCRSNCPVNNIENGIKWSSKCEACLRCFTICPNNAIRHGKMSDPRMFKKFHIKEDVKEFIYG